MNILESKAGFSDFETLVQKMRSAQKRYFSTKCRTALQDSKILERSVDAFLASKLPPQEAPVDNQINLFGK